MPAEPLPRSPRHGFFDQEIGWITSTGKLFGASRGARLARGDLAAVTVTSHRRILDRLVGYKASPILWHSIKTGLSAGRVQTVALRLIVEREREIRAFKPQEYWTIEALCAKDGQTFEAALAKVGGHKPQLNTESDARAVVDAVRPRPFVVTKVEKRNRKKNPGAPFTTSKRCSLSS